MVPVHVVSQEASPGVKRGGTLNIVEHSIELLVPVDAIPDALEADRSPTSISAISLHISAITLPEGAKATSASDDLTLVTSWRRRA